MGMTATMVNNNTLDCEAEAKPLASNADPFLLQYCAEHSVSPDSFEIHLLRRVIFAHFLFVLPFLWILGPNVLHPERRLMILIGRCRTLEEVQNNIDFYQHKNVVNSFWRGPLRFRISGKKLMSIAKRLSLRER